MASTTRPRKSAVAEGGRTLTTRSTPPMSWRSARATRNASRTRRLARLRCTARPSERAAVTAIRGPGSSVRSTRAANAERRSARPLERTVAISRERRRRAARITKDRIRRRRCVCGRARDGSRGPCGRPSSSYERGNRALARVDASLADMCASRSSPFSPVSGRWRVAAVIRCVLWSSLYERGPRLLAAGCLAVRRGATVRRLPAAGRSLVFLSVGCSRRIVMWGASSLCSSAERASR